MTAKTMGIIEQRVLIGMAGMAAERRLAGRRNWRGGRQDREQAIDLASYRHSDPDVLGKYIAYLIARADELMGSPVIWRRLRL
jgi:hypothetical protein